MHEIKSTSQIGQVHLLFFTAIACANRRLNEGSEMEQSALGVYYGIHVGPKKKDFFLFFLKFLTCKVCVSVNTQRAKEN